METAEHPPNVGRRLRIIGIVAGLAAAGLGALVPAAYAQGPSASTPTAKQKVAILGARPTKAPHLKTGRFGAAFAPRTSTSGTTPNVVGGTPVNSADYPGVVGIETNFVGDWKADGTPNWYVGYCTGTVISPTKVLTAGHCAVDNAFGTTYVIAGRNNLDDQTQGGQVEEVATTWTDQKFNLNALYTDPNAVPSHDVSVLTLKNPLQSQYTPVTLSPQGDQTPYQVGTQADVVGYGQTNPYDTSPSAVGTLYKTTLPIQDDTTCAANLQGYDPTTMTCAGAPSGSPTPSPTGSPTPPTGPAACHGDSGGPLFGPTGTKTEIGIIDWGAPNCDSYSVFERLSYYNSEITQDEAKHGLVNLDWTGDGASDLFTRDANGYLKVHSGGGFLNDGSNGFVGAAYPYPNYGWSTTSPNAGWNTYNKLFRVTNWNNNNKNHPESVMGRDSSGRLWQYQSDGAGDFVGSRVQIGSGWGMFSDIMVTNNWTGDGHPNILGRTPAGDLYLYTSNGTGGWENGGVGVKIGTGWNMFNTVLTPGDWKSDGHQALIGRTSTGDLRLYESDGHGGWVNGAGVKIGTGWNMFSIFMSPGDWNGDDNVDLIGITPAGAMRLYTTDGKGNWIDGSGPQIATGWNVYNQVF